MDASQLTKTLSLLAAHLLLAFNGWAQSELLEKPVSLSHTQQPLATVLLDLQQNYGLSFSYFNDPAALQSPVSIHTRQQPLKSVLHSLLTGTGLQYQLVGNQIVLKETPPSFQKRLQGKVIDKLTRAPLVAASIVVDQALGTVTDADGNFSLSWSDSSSSSRLTVSFVGYQTASLSPVHGQSAAMVIELEQQSQVLNEVVVNEKGRFYLLPKTAADILENYRKDTVQFVHDPKGNVNGLILAGRVMDQATRQPALFCKISLPDYQTRLVTSLSGAFQVSLPASYRGDTLVFSSLIYEECRVAVSALQSGADTIWVRKRMLQGEAVIAKLGEHHRLVELGIANIARNYPPTPSLLEERYRETLRVGQTDTYLLDAQAALQVYKPSYQVKDAAVPDQMRVVPSASNRVFMFRLQHPEDWPYNGLLNNRFSVDGLDVAKGPSTYFMQSKQYAFFSNELLFRKSVKDYQFQLLDMVTLDGKQVYVLGFEPSRLLKSAYFQGRLYVEVNNLAFVRAEYQLTTAGLHLFNYPYVISPADYPAMLLLRREYVVNYVPYQGFWSLDRASIENEYIPRTEYVPNVKNTPITSRIEFEVTERYEGRAAPLKRARGSRFDYDSLPFVYQILELNQPVKGRANARTGKVP